MNELATAPETQADAVTARVIAEKTAYWQQSMPAVNHLSVSGERPRGVYMPVARKMMSFIPPKSKVLDVGCGHGRMSLPLAEAGHRVVATDVSAKMLELLNLAKGGLPIETRQGDAHRLAAADDEFDVVLSCDFIPHFPDWPHLLAEKARVCRPGGLILFGFNFAEHKQYAEPFNGGRYEHPYSPDVNSKKPFWAECKLETMLREAEKLGLKLTTIAPLKFLHENVAFGGALGTTEYRAFQVELGRRLEADPAVAEFFCWLEDRLFQRLPFFASYLSLLVFERPLADQGSVPTPAAPSSAAASGRPSSPTVDLDRFLDAIPSETTPAERRLLFDYFRQKWDGNGLVVEIGPFLGGTTRAIAAGMARNPLGAPGAVLHTYDRFDAYYSPEKLREAVQPLVMNGGLAATQADDLCRSANFERLFSAIHSPHDYHRLVRLHNSPLPDLPEELATSTPLANLNGQGEIGALFVDGCKSWASTRYALEYLLPRMRIGAPVIFQDYGWYTCFWITSATYALRDFFELETHVDATYVFRLKGTVSANDVATRFASAPAEMGDAFFAQAAAALFEDSRASGDLRGELIAQLHQVAALATLGRRGPAAAILKAVNVKRYGAFASMISGCIKSPTYLPGGKQVLW